MELSPVNFYDHVRSKLYFLCNVRSTTSIARLRIQGVLNYLIYLALWLIVQVTVVACKSLQFKRFAAISDP